MKDSFNSEVNSQISSENVLDYFNSQFSFSFQQEQDIFLSEMDENVDFDFQTQYSSDQQSQKS